MILVGIFEELEIKSVFSPKLWLAKTGGHVGFTV